MSQKPDCAAQFEAWTGVHGFYGPRNAKKRPSKRRYKRRLEVVKRMLIITRLGGSVRISNSKTPDFWKEPQLELIIRKCERALKEIE